MRSRETAIASVNELLNDLDRHTGGEPRTPEIAAKRAEEEKERAEAREKQKTILLSGWKNTEQNRLGDAIRMVDREIGGLLGTVS